jgi:predicted dehydrogenase
MSGTQQDPSRKLKIGFAGTGNMGQCAHLRNYATLPECEVTAISDIREKTAALVARRHGVRTVYKTAEEMLEKEELDAVVASQYFGHHGILLPRLLKAGIPMFIEKPLSSTVASGEKILEEAAKSRTWIMVGYHKRSDPASMLAKREIEKLKASGELGKLKYIRALMPSGNWVSGGYFDLVNADSLTEPLPCEPPPEDMDKDGFNTYKLFVNFYIHQVNLIRYFLGEDYDVTYADPAGVLLAGRSASGVTCSLEMTPYQTTLDWQESVLICFERGWIKLELPAPLVINTPGKITIFRDPGNGAPPETVIPQLPPVHAMRQQAVNFLAAVRGDMKPMCDAAEALKDLKTARQYIKLWKNI